MRLIALFSALVLTGVALAGDDLPVSRGLPLRAMDARLTAAGWKPAHTPIRLTLEGSSVGTIYRAGYHAVEMCSGTAANPCVFNYVKKKKCLRIVTVGEYNPPEYEPVVDSWTFACPGKP